METPEEKARRLGVPLIPKVKPPSQTVAVCGECGLELQAVMSYSCSRINCPCGFGGAISYVYQTSLKGGA